MFGGSVTRRIVLAGGAATAVGGGACFGSSPGRSVTVADVRSVRGISVDDDVEILHVEAFARPDDGGAAAYVRSTTRPEHPGRLQTADGAWWVLADSVVVPQMFGAIADGRHDCRKSLTDAIATAVALGRSMRPARGEYRLSADPVEAWCLNIPSNAVLNLEDGPVFKADDRLSSWKRVVSMTRASDVKIHGILKVDGNVENIASDNNEHMHGVFVFDCANLVIDAIEAHNCRGDNVFIGGTEDSVGSVNIKIGSIRASVAGRKNLVLGNCRQVDIDTAWLDNRQGGARLHGGATGDTDGHCLDVEPDVFSGKVENGASINRLTCLGSGLDFSAGISAAAADAWTLRIGELTASISPRSGVPAWLQYGITIIARRILLTGLDGVDAQSCVLYAGRLIVEDFTIGGERPGDAILLISQVGGHRPNVRFDRCRVVNTATGGVGIENRDSNLAIGAFTPSTSSIALWNRGLSPDRALTTVTKIEVAMLDTVGDPHGLGYAMLSTKNGANSPRLVIGRLRHRDARRPPIDHVLHFGPGTAAGGEIGEFDSATRIPLRGAGQGASELARLVTPAAPPLPKRLTKPGAWGPSA